MSGGDLVPLRAPVSGGDLVPGSSQGFIVELLQTLIDQQTWSDSGSVSERVLRSYLLLFACVRDHAPCVEKASRLFHSWKALDGNMRSVTQTSTDRLSVWPHLKVQKSALS